MTNNDSEAGSSMTDPTGASNVPRCRGRPFRSSMRTWTGRPATSVKQTSTSTPSRLISGFGWIVLVAAHLLARSSRTLPVERAAPITPRPPPR
jgi:hypothetical protein